jgi:6-phosphogluconolactonase (cycloisomerase 2 family)
MKKMKKINFIRVSMAIAVMFLIGSCKKNADKNFMQDDHPRAITEEMMSENGANPDEESVALESASISANTESASNYGGGHYLYSESNETGSNQILIYKIRFNGSLEFEGAVASGGAGTGMGLGSQGALVLDKQHEWLYAVNAGSNSVSSFKVHNDGSLTLVHTESSGGIGPNSVSVYGNLLYVLNHGSDNISGLRINGNGKLIPIANSTQPLTTTGTDAPQISFTPNGEWLIVPEKVTNKINTFRIKNNGSVWPAVVTNSAGPTPFGFDFARNNLMIISNAAGGNAGAGSATSYFIGGNGALHALNGAVDNHQSAPCWTATTKYGRFAFITNAGSNSISSYYVAPWGGLYLVNKVAAATEQSPVDIVVAKNNYFVYNLNAKSGSINEFHRTLFGGLHGTGTTSGLPLSSTGLATY